MFFAGYATLPRQVSNGPSPEELEQQRRYRRPLNFTQVHSNFNLLIVKIVLAVLAIFGAT